jgi:hypothetical protein
VAEEVTAFAVVLAGQADVRAGRAAKKYQFVVVTAVPGYVPLASAILLAPTGLAGGA